MQYKTITVEHKWIYKKKEELAVGSQYQEIINQEAILGWNLLGIHPVHIKRRMGCLKSVWYGFIFFVFGVAKQADILIFFREGDPNEILDENDTGEIKKYGEAMKKMGAAMSGTMNFMKSEETANKLGDLKNKFSGFKGSK